MAVLLIAVALLGAEPRLIDPDTWWHVTVGEQILKTHSWPTSDAYSFTARGAPWIAYEWLGEVFMALAVKAGGLIGLAWFQKVVVIALTLLLYLYAYLVREIPKPHASRRQLFCRWHRWRSHCGRRHSVIFFCC